MAIKNKRQSSTTASPAAPTSLNYGEIAIANDGTIYAGDKSNKATSKVSFADTCDLAGNAVNASAADSAETATKDASGNTITTSYASSIAISGNNIQLKSKSNAVLSTITAPYATAAGSCNSIGIYNSNWSGKDGSISAIYADANKSYVNLTAANGNNTAWPNISVQRLNGHLLDFGYDGNLWISW